MQLGRLRQCLGTSCCLCQYPSSVHYLVLPSVLHSSLHHRPLHHCFGPKKKIGKPKFSLCSKSPPVLSSGFFPLLPTPVSTTVNCTTNCYPARQPAICSSSSIFCFSYFPFLGRTHSTKYLRIENLKKAAVPLCCWGRTQREKKLTKTMN